MNYNIFEIFAAFQIKWQPVVVGFLFQFILGILCIRWEVGRKIFQCFGEKVESLLGFTDEGSSFVYGDLLINKESVFAFRVSTFKKKKN